MIEWAMAHLAYPSKPAMGLIVTQLFQKLILKFL